MDTPDHFTTDEMLRIEALDRAVRISLAQNGNEMADVVVTRAEKFYAFLTSTPEPRTIQRADVADTALGTVVRDYDDDVAVRVEDGWDIGGVETTRPDTYLSYPLTVLAEPQTS